MNVALHPEPLNILSICTGGGGLDLRIELAVPGARAVCLVEREAFAVAHLVAAMQQGLMAPAPVWSDARTFDGRPWRCLVDGLIGGIPCQPHSLAGKRLAEEDERDLWSTTRRIVVQARPWFVLIENVNGMLTSGGAERVWRDLGRLGYEREIGLFTASEVGASHERKRLFILAVADAGRAEWRAHPRGGCLADGAEAGWRESAGRAAKSNPEMAVSKPPRFKRWESKRQRSGSVVSSDFVVMDDPAFSRGGPISIQSGRQGKTDSHSDWPGLFPPSPNDASGWRRILERTPHLEPAFRRVADGLASRLDVARMDRLRLLGNGVVPLEAAHAFRTLAARLAGRSAAAAQLVRMMDAS